MVQAKVSASICSMLKSHFTQRPCCEPILNPDLLLPRIGVDESGKGDFFGPLCIAGAYINESVVKAWQDKGIRDSKNISDLAELIRKTPSCRNRRRKSGANVKCLFSGIFQF
jgi:ribonuclease HIII